MGRRKLAPRAQTVYEPFEGIPRYWLSVPKCGKPIQLPTNPKISFILAKTPLANNIKIEFSQDDNWSVADLVSKVKSTSSSPVVVINVSPSLSLVSKEEYESQQAEYHHIPIDKSYSEDSLNAFLDKVKTYDSATFVVISRLGINRPGFCTAAAISNMAGEDILPALNRVNNSLTQNLFSSKASSSLQKIFNVESLPFSTTPEWRQPIDNSGSLSKISATMNRTSNWLKIKAASQTPEDEALVHDVVKDVQDIRVHYWNEHSTSDILKKKCQCSFIPRGTPGYLVILEDGRVAFYDRSESVHYLLARSTLGKSAVVFCYISNIESKIICLLTDLLSYDSVSSSLDERMNILYSVICPSLQGTEGSQLNFIFRPLAKFNNALKLKQEHKNLYVKIDGVEFIPGDEKPGDVIFLPTEPSVSLRFEYNGGNKALLLAGAGKDYIPAAVMNVPSIDYVHLGGKTSTFVYDSDKKEWKTFEIGVRDSPCSTLSDIRDYMQFVEGSFNVDAIFEDLAQRK